MASVHVKYLLLGGGSAAAACAQAIRELDEGGDVMLISAEAGRPYHRPPLARGYLRRELPLEQIYFHPPEWYSSHRVTLRTSTRAMALDVAKRVVTLVDGTQVRFDTLAIATGAIPRPLTVPGGNLPGVMSFRTVEDVNRIHHAAEVAMKNPVGRVVVVGGGVLAVEVAASLATMRDPAGRKLRVTLACGTDQLLPQLAGRHVSRSLARVLDGLAVEVKHSEPVLSVEGDGRAQRVRTPSRELQCDFVVAAEGFQPSKEFLRGTNIESEKAILTNPQGETNVPGIFAAGECAAMFDTVFGKHRVLDHWDVTVSRGLVVGANMAGANRPWMGVTVHRAEVGATRVALIGEPRFADRQIVRDLGLEGLAEFGVDREGRICSAVLLGTGSYEDTLVEYVRQRPGVQGKEDSLRDPSQPLPVCPQLLG